MMRVEVYYNLHRKLWSVRALEGPRKGKVIHHLTSVCLLDVKFVVQPAGREKVRREKQKTIHAFARGRMVNVMAFNAAQKAHAGAPADVTYNPYTDETFVDRRDRRPVRRAACCHLFLMGPKPTLAAYGAEA